MLQSRAILNMSRTCDVTQESNLISWCHLASVRSCPLRGPVCLCSEGQHASFLQQTVEQEANAHMQAMNAMAEMVRALQADVRQVKDKN